MMHTVELFYHAASSVCASRMTQQVIGLPFNPFTLFDWRAYAHRVSASATPVRRIDMLSLSENLPESTTPEHTALAAYHS
jgi:hypothetical protein